MATSWVSSYVLALLLFLSLGCSESWRIANVRAMTAVFVLGITFSAGSDAGLAPAAAGAVERNGVRYTKASCGLAYYDYPSTSSSTVSSNTNDADQGVARETAVQQRGSKVSIDVKGYLAGRNGWQFIDTTAEGGEPLRLITGQSKMIRGLEMGLSGAGCDDVPPMEKGRKRRLVIPSRLGYVSAGQDEAPMPTSEDNRRRLYSTVFNRERGVREKEALGDSIVGELILDVDLRRVKNPR